MPRFKTKIDASDNSRVYHADELNWCLRQVEANLRAFKAEFMRRYGIGGGIPARQILNDLLPDPPAAPVNDDARDAARFRWMSNFKGQHLIGCGVYALLLPGEALNEASYFYTLAEAIDAAMEREAK